MKHARPITGLILAILILLFTIQNLGAVTVRMLFWEFSISQALLIFFVLAAGIVLGWLIAGWLHWQRTRKQRAR